LRKINQKQWNLSEQIKHDPGKLDLKIDTGWIGPVEAGRYVKRGVKL